MSKLSGVVPPIGTPVTPTGSVDEAALRRLTRYLLNAGVNGILANGTMGGFAFLTDDEQIRAVSSVVTETDGAVPVIGGIGETCTSRAIQKAKRIAAEGITDVAILAPFYFFASQDNLYAYFSEIASAIDLPIYIYDNPVMTKNSIHPETVARLREDIPHVVGIKESNQDCLNLQKLIELNKQDGFSILTGSEHLIVVGLQMGCDGFIGGLHNICPQIAVALYRAFLDDDIDRARQLQRDLTAMCAIFNYGNIWGGFDQALRHLNIADCATAAPYVSNVTPEEASKVNAIVDRYVGPYLLSEAKSSRSLKLVER